jgi:proline iminopeptidase
LDKPKLIKADKEGFVEVLGFKLFYRIFGEQNKKGVLLCLHGGPGATHDYLSPLADLTSFGYKVVMYDQLGCGRSQMPYDTSYFTIERGVEEVEGVRAQLSLGKVHLIGHSYGGLLAIAYALKYQQNLKSLIIASGLASVPLTISEMNRLKSELPKEVYDILIKYEQIGDYENPEYQKAVEVFYKRYVCRLEPWPEDFVYTIEHLSKPVYYTMNGPNEFTITGTIKDYDATQELYKINLPCLITVGKYDEVTPKVAQSIHERIKRSKLVVFENSSHLAMWEEREKYMQVVRDFLDSIKV